jgi:hypothetical protein
MPEPFAMFEDNDIAASKYVSETMKRAVKQLSGAVRDEEKSTADAAESNQLAARIISMLKPLNLSLRNTLRKLGGKTPNYEIVARIPEQIDALEAPLRQLNVEYVDADKMRAMTTEFRYLFKWTSDLEIKKRSGSQSDINKNLYDAVTYASDQLKPVVQAVLDVQGIALPKEVLAEPVAQVEDTAEIAGAGFGQASHIDRNSFAFKRYL